MHDSFLDHFAKWIKEKKQKADSSRLRVISAYIHKPYFIWSQLRTENKEMKYITS